MEELAGTTVMIHPKLTQDPINMQGCVGTISNVLYEDCASYVNFGLGHFGVYNNDALLMLMPTEVALGKLPNDIDAMDLDPSEVLDIFRISILNESGIPEKQETALRLALASPVISAAIVFTVQDWVDFQIARLDQQQNPGRGR
ncbi:hypothetical protein [Sphingobacterium kitahiroshimense]|uniref:Uncharacterized protein n=1 Tax=Sphingobacterium kitahiroshimense TaxID=470446 RepID=A0ABV0BN81_9SPHI